MPSAVQTMADFVALLQRLAAGKVDFVLVGGLAASAHGCSLVTQDVDICIRLGAENLERLQKALHDLEPVHRMAREPLPFSHDAATLASFLNIYLRTGLGQLDCLGEVLAIGDFEAARQQSVEIDLGGEQIRVLSLDALIAAKSAMTRDRDRAAVEQLRRIRSHSTGRGSGKPE
jgi:hypothetical protein